MTTKKEQSNQVQTDIVQAESASPQEANQLAKIAKSILSTKSVSSGPMTEEDVAALVYLLDDNPELTAKLRNRSSAAESVITRESSALSPEQLLNMARHHFAAKAGPAAADHSAREINRFVREYGIL